MSLLCVFFLLKLVLYYLLDNAQWQTHICDLTAKGCILNSLSPSASFFISFPSKSSQNVTCMFCDISASQLHLFIPPKLAKHHGDFFFPRFLKTLMLQSLRVPWLSLSTALERTSYIPLLQTQLLLGFWSTATSWVYCFLLLGELLPGVFPSCSLF